MRPLQSALLLLPLFMTVPAARAQQPALPADPDERLLKEVGCRITDGELIAFLKERSEGPGTGLKALVRQLGSDDFAEREDAQRRLIAYGAKALPDLRAAVNDPDAEIAYRARVCVAEIVRSPRLAAPAAVARLLARRRPAGASAALLRYLPHAADGDMEEQVWLALAALAPRDEKFGATLVAALQDAEPARRAVAACLLGRSDDAATRAAVRRLLDDPDATVRLRAAQGLLAGRDPAALPALIALLEARPAALAWQAEELLHWAAGGGGPAAVVGAGSAGEGKACRAAWQEWWEKRGAQRDPSDFGRGARPGSADGAVRGRPAGALATRRQAARAPAGRPTHLFGWPSRISFGCDSYG
jgi:hypothetical protein